MASNSTSLNIQIGVLPIEETAVFLCDLQEKFRPAMLHFSEVISNAKKLVESTKILGIPLLVTEQYPQGLGGTVGEIDIKHAVATVSKTKFSMVVPEIESAMKKVCNGQIKCVILFGVEAHVCVEQTAMDLITKHQIKVHIVADATTSRTQEDRLLALKRLEQMGCIITTSENVIYKLLGDKNHPKFNEVRPLIKDTTLETGLVSKMDQSTLFTKLPWKLRLEFAHSVLIELSNKSDLQISNASILNVAQQITTLTNKSTMGSKIMITNKSKKHRAQDVSQIANQGSIKNESSGKSCSICFKSFTRPQDLKRHLRIHDETSHFLCEECGKTFKSPDGLHYHKALNHNTSDANTANPSMPSPSFNCTECKKTFATQLQLKTHLKNSHFRAKSIFTCTICVPERVFTRKDVFKSHNASHEVAKPFTCLVCDKNFSSRSNLRSHSRTHNSLSSIQCQICAKKFNSLKKLTTHITYCVNRKLCPLCKFVCYEEAEMTGHMKKTHPVDYAFKSVFGPDVEDLG